MWSTVELRELRIFLVLADELHFARTAERLHLTPSRVSQTIRQLETRVGAPLFERTSRRVALTPSGTRLRDDLRPAMKLIDEALTSARVAGGAITGTLRIGELFSAAGSRFVEIISGFEARHPACQVVMIDVPATNALGSLLRGELDLLAIRLPINRSDLVVGPVLSSEPRVLAVAPDHPLAGRESVTLEDVADYDVARFDYLPRELLEDLIPFETPGGRKIRRLHDPQPQTIAEVASLVALGRIVHPTVPTFARRFGQPQIAVVPITGMPRSRTGLVWRRQNKDPRIHEFARVTESILRGIDGPARPGRGAEDG